MNRPRVQIVGGDGIPYRDVQTFFFDAQPYLDRLTRSARHILNPPSRVVSAAPSTTGNREHRSTRRHATHSARSSGDSSDSDEPPARRCARPGCNTSLEGFGPKAKTCSSACRSWLRDERKRQAAKAEHPLELLADAAISLVELGALEPWQALYEVVIPGPELRAMVERVAA